MLTKANRKKHAALVLVFGCSLLLSSMARAEGDFAAMTSMVNLMDSFMGLMDSVYEMNADDEKAVLLQMHAIEEIYKQQGKHPEAVAMYRKVLDNSKNSAIRNLAYNRMADVLKESGDLKTAIEVLNAALAETLARTK